MTAEAHAAAIEGAVFTGTTFRGDKLYCGERCGMFVVWNGKREYVTKHISAEDKQYYSQCWYVLLHNQRRKQ